jgi:fumarylacetoacetase
LALLEDRFVPAPQQDPEPLPYLRTEGDWALDIELEVELGGTVVSRTNTRGLYWTMPQQLAHATVNGASIATGDLFASGTICGPEHGRDGSLIELTRNGDIDRARRRLHARLPRATTRSCCAAGPVSSSCRGPWHGFPARS